MSVLSEEEIKELESIPGETIGSGIKEDLAFVLKKTGEEGLARVEKEMSEIGISVSLKTIESFQWYPWRYNLAIFLIVKKLFNWSDDDFRENGAFGAKTSAVVRVMLKYFISLESSIKKVEEYWTRYYTFGNAKVADFDEKTKRATLVYSGFKGVEPFCRILEGYSKQMIAYSGIPLESVRVEEEECVCRGGQVHRFKVSW